MPLTLNLQYWRFPTSPFIRISTAADGTQADGDSLEASFSTDGRYVLFESYASNLVAGDTNAAKDVFIKDIVTGDVRRISTSSTGAPANGDSYTARFSANGRYVVFESEATDLVAGDTNGATDIFRKDLVTGEIVRVSTTSSGAEVDNDSSEAQISADGRYVFFQARAALVAEDTNANGDIYRKDLLTGQIILVSTAADGTLGNDDSEKVQISADGRYALFTSYARNLVSGDTNNTNDVFRKDLTTGAIVRVSAAADGTQTLSGSYDAHMSANGRYVVFTSGDGNLVAGDANGASDIFRKDLVTGEIVRVSVTADGMQGNGSSERAKISEDGRYVTFVSSAGNFVAGDTNNSSDIFRKDLLTGELILLSTTLVPAQGKEQANALSDWSQVSADGRYVTFTSDATNLIAGDSNRAQDIFRKDLVTGDVIRVSTGTNGAQADVWSSDAHISADGRYVVFDSFSNILVPGDSNGANDVFRKDTSTGELVRVSTSSTGGQANGSSNRGDASSDGRFVVFESLATNLVAGDTNSQQDVFLKDLQTGGLVRVSVAADGAQANGVSFSAHVSDNGRYVTFCSLASNLVARDTNNDWDIFRKDLETGAVVRVNTAADGSQTGGTRDTVTISADGRYVVFSTNTNNLVANDTNNTYDVFCKDVETGAIVRVSTAADGMQGNSSSEEARISPDGRYVVFTSYASNLVAGDTNGTADIFLKDLQTGEVKLVSTATDGTRADGASSHGSISADGRYVVFSSNATNLVAEDVNNAKDIFRKDLVTGEIVCVSMSNTDAQGYVPVNKSSGDPQIRSGGQVIVLSSSASNIVAGDTNKVSDTYLVDTDFANRQAMAEGRFVDLSFGVGAASSVSIAWGDGATDAVAPVFGTAFLRHAYATTGTKSATVTVREADKTWDVPYTINLAGKTAARNTALSDTLSGGAGGDQLTGDGFANVLIGNGGNDNLDGGAGSDTAVFSGQRADYVIVKDAAGVITVTDKQAGRDGADVLKNVDFARFADQTLDLASLPTGTGTGGGGTGGVPVAKILIGTKARDVLTGGQGNDKLYGGYGNDVLTGGAGQDVFVFNAKLGTARTDRKVNFDRITDFSVKDDTLWLDNKYMAKLGKGTELKPGKLSKKFFVVGDKAKDGNDYLIYNRKTGVLSYDADGNGAGEAIEVAQLARNLKITSADFMVV